MNLPETFFNPKQAREKANHSSKKKANGKRKGEKNSKVEKPKAIGHFLVQKLKILISAHTWAKMS